MKQDKVYICKDSECSNTFKKHKSTDKYCSHTCASKNTNPLKRTELKRIPLKLSQKSIDKIIKYQEKVKSKGKQCLVIIDDSISCVDNSFQSLVNKLFSKGRHWNISIVLINQYIKHVISPIVRSDIDYLLYSVNSVNILQYMYDIVIYDGNIKEFIKWSQDNTKDFQFIMYKNIHGGEFLFVKAPEKLILEKANFGKKTYYIKFYLRYIYKYL